MRLRFINPNSTASMTAKVLDAASAVAPAGLIVEAVTSTIGPPSIQGPADGEAALPGLLQEVARAERDSVDVVALACFDDTGIAEARAATALPVIGIGQASFLASLALGHRFSVVTTLAVSIPVIEANLAHAGIALGTDSEDTRGCARVRASGVPVLDLERDGEAGEAARARVAAEIERALAEDGIGAIVLGCAGMADLAARFEQRFGLPVIDGVVAAVRMVPMVTGRL